MVTTTPTFIDQHVKPYDYRLVPLIIFQLSEIHHQVTDHFTQVKTHV